MSIINEHYWPSLGAYFINFQPYPKQSHIRFTDKSPDVGLRNYADGEYWYVEFNVDTVFYCYSLDELMPAATMDKLKNKKLTLVLCNRFEPYHFIVDGIYQYIILKHDIPTSQVLLLSNSADINLEIERVSKKYNRGEIKAEWVREAEFWAQGIAREPQNLGIFATDTLAHKQYDKKYLSFNGAPRSHRMLLVSLLLCYDLVEKGHLSYNSNPNSGPPDSGEQTYTNVIKWCSGDTELTRLIESKKAELVNLTMLRLDTTPENHIHMEQFHYTDKKLYEDTYFSIVTESWAMVEHGRGAGLGRTFSEKTFKPILNRHPFILLAAPGCLKLLKQLGYKTFSPYINEEYDDELDDIKRIHMIVKETKRLANLSTTELDEFLSFCKDVVEHNYNTLITTVIQNEPLNYTT